jgi:hypothetical protein
MNAHVNQGLRSGRQVAGMEVVVAARGRDVVGPYDIDDLSSRKDGRRLINIPAMFAFWFDSGWAAAVEMDVEDCLADIDERNEDSFEFLKGIASQSTTENQMRFWCIDAMLKIRPGNKATRRILEEMLYEHGWLKRMSAYNRLVTNGWRDPSFRERLHLLLEPRK